MIVFLMQGAWWKTTELDWALVCHYKKTKPSSILDLTRMATKLSSRPTNLMRSMLCYDTSAWSKKRWRKVYRKIPHHTRLLLEKHFSNGGKTRTSFKPFLIRRVSRS